jgi:hypothetical protein
MMAMQKGIAKIKAKTGAIVDAIQFTYSDGSESVIGGAGGGWNAEHVLNQGDFITSVAYTKESNGYWKNCITGVEFRTMNSGSYKVGVLKENPIAVKAPNGEIIVELKGDTTKIAGQTNVYLSSIEIANTMKLPKMPDFSGMFSGFKN